MGTNPRGQYASVNGLNLYYEIYCTGQPLVLLHGGLGTVEMLLGPFLPPLVASRQLIAVELQAHGHTADIDRPLSFEAMADDIGALIQHLGLETADVLGYSLGGGVALQTAIRHPEVVRKLVLLSTPYQRAGWYPEVLAGMAGMTAEAAPAWVGSPPHAVYAAAAPRPDDWPVLVGKIGALLKQDYDWSAGIAALTTPTLIVVGDADSVRTAHAVAMFGLLGGGQRDGGMDGQGVPNSQLAILPGTTHFTIVARTDLLLAAIVPFLAAPLPERT